MRSAFGASFDVPAGYLNTPSIGIPPERAGEAVSAAVRRWRCGGDDPVDFDEPVAASRAGFARLVGVDAERVALGSTVSQLVALVAAGVPEGGRVLLAEGDFTSVGFPFAVRARASGGTVTEVPLGELVSSVDGHDVVAVSVVQSADGRMVHLPALRAACAATGARVLLDVTQAAGWLPLRLDWADWVVCAGYKWLMAPRGAAWLAVRPEAMERTVPVAANWYAGTDPWRTTYGLPLRLAAGARGLDLSPVWHAHLGAAATLEYLAGLDPAAVREHCTGLADLFLERLGQAARGSAIVSLTVDGAAERLAAAGVRAGVRAGRARVGFHLYNTVDDVELAARALS
ncbi:aminotransferase [Amycolatopsis antarctica]|uniref:Aminotransferase n=1 Tax=Amycolatopsis antarctica TaxID=1854586 RepID=A0A263D7D1_9PSEU|nr:aminotransferase class V-fold PLP-dependent enzyme [Amycolatopsis antarctica]OZM74380.1 aminotransferase [Amycolatopsis antarctica]